MQQFIPFEDDWDALENLRPESLVPYNVGVRCRHDLAEPDKHAGPTFPAMANASPGSTPTTPAALRAGNSST